MISIHISLMVTYLLFSLRTMPLVNVGVPFSNCILVCFSWHSLTDTSSSVSRVRNHWTVKLSTVNVFGWSFPSVSLSSISDWSNWNMTGVGGEVLFVRKFWENGERNKKSWYEISKKFSLESIIPHRRHTCGVQEILGTLRQDLCLVCCFQFAVEYLEISLM